MSISRLQGTSGDSTGQLASLAYGSTLTVNSLLLVVVQWADASGLPSVSGTQNGSFGTAVKSTYYTNNSDNCGVALFALVNTKGAVSETINVTYGTGSDYTSVFVEEYSGCATSSPGDGSAEAYVNPSNTNTGWSGVTDAITSGTFSTTTDGDLVFAFTLIVGSDTSITTAHGTNFTQGQTRDPWGTAYVQEMTEYLTQATHGSSTAGTFTMTDASHPNIRAIVVAAAFKAAAGAFTQMSRRTFGPRVGSRQEINW